MAKTSLELQAPLQNIGKVKFDTPKVPVIFILGGPGSGKVTHCDTLTQEKKGLIHINMMDLLQQYAIGNDMQDFSQLASKTVTEVLMLEMKMSPQAKAYLISGYPRSMRDVVEYSEKIQIVNGVILISWRQAVLQKQIDYGAKLGHVVLSLAKMELENFFKHVMPVADYFDQSSMLIAVNGERTPSEVYQDFRIAVFDILNQQEDQEALLNGVAGIGNGEHNIPGSIVSVDTAPIRKDSTSFLVAERYNENASKQTSNTMRNTKNKDSVNMNYVPNSLCEQAVILSNHSKVPHIIWVIGGPGSNKATLCLKAVGINPGWGHISIGRLLRAISESEVKPFTEEFDVKEALANGEMVKKYTLDKLIEKQLKYLSGKIGVIIDGYPRDITQANYFESRYKQKPPIVLLDCSKLQLGRGRIDDTVSSFRRRLELFRESTLPMLKHMDTSGRLTIVDGDTDSPIVQREFERIIRQKIDMIMENERIQNENNHTKGSFSGFGKFRDQIKN
ncbi:adenylate kinase isoenzyme 5 [Culicoides brevitarsis]|uniref:adenylate kinase isoenzyme 5 n=1 Tax=Culicoides brevitarsis TaxID=469753 RepID=UPI00307BE55A